MFLLLFWVIMCAVITGGMLLCDLFNKGEDDEE